MNPGRQRDREWKVPHILFGSAKQWLSDRLRKALQFGSLYQRKILVVDEVHTVAACQIYLCRFI